MSRANNRASLYSCAECRLLTITAMRTRTFPFRSAFWIFGFAKSHEMHSARTHQLIDVFVICASRADFPLLANSHANPNKQTEHAEPKKKNIGRIEKRQQNVHCDCSSIRFERIAPFRVLSVFFSISLVFFFFLLLFSFRSGSAKFSGQQTEALNVQSILSHKCVNALQRIIVNNKHINSQGVKISQNKATQCHIHTLAAASIQRRCSKTGKLQIS